MVESVSMNDAIRPSPNGAFSALTPSMWPQDILARLTQPEVSNRLLFYQFFQGNSIFEYNSSQRIQTINPTIDSMNLVLE